MSDINQEFLEANAGIIERIASEVQYRSENVNDGVTVVCDGVTGEAKISSGAYEAEDFAWQFSQYPDSIALELAEYAADCENNLVEYKAENMFEVVISGASLTRTFGLLEAGDIDREEALKQAEINLKYGSAIFRLSRLQLDDNGAILESSHGRLNNVEHFGTVEAFNLAVREQVGFSRELRIHKLGSKITHIAFVTRLEDDPLRFRCLELFGVDIAGLLSLFNGLYDTEDDLDYELNEAWLSFQGTSKEQEVGSVLDELRERAIAAKQTRELNMTHNTNLPTIDQLEEFVGLLAES